MSKNKDLNYISEYDKSIDSNECLNDNNAYSNILQLLDIIEKTKFAEVINIAEESILSLLLDNPYTFIMFIINGINYSKNKNKRMVKEIKNIIDKFMKQVDIISYFSVMLKNDIENIIHLSKNIIGKYSNNNIDFVTIDIDDSIKNTYKYKLQNSLFLLNDYVIDDLDVKNTQRLLSPKISNEKVEENSIFNEFDDNFKLKILCGDDKELKKDFEDMKKINNKNSSNSVNNILNDKTISISYIHSQLKEYMIKDIKYSNKSDKKLIENENYIENQNNKNYLVIKYSFNFIPFYNIISLLVKLNHSSFWETRMSSIFLLDSLLKMGKQTLGGFKANLTYRINKETKEFYILDNIDVFPCDILDNDIDDSINNSKINIYSNAVTNKITICNYLKHIIDSLIINSIIDEVSDFNSINNHICIFKELNLSLAINLFNNVNNITKEKIIRSLLSQFLKILNNLPNNDWHPTYSILLFFSYIKDFNLDFYENMNFYTGFIINYPKLLNMSQEIVSTSNKVLLEILKLQMSNINNKTNELCIKQSNIDIITDSFALFLEYSVKFDDIDYSVQSYLECFNIFLEVIYGNFNLFYNEENSNNNSVLAKNKKCLKFTSSLKRFINEDLIYFAFSQIIKVREEFYKIATIILNFNNNIKRLINNTDIIDAEFLKRICIVAFQTLCIEEDKYILRNAYYFLFSVLIYFENLSKNFLNYIEKGLRSFYKLHIVDNIKSLKYFYIPKLNKNNSKNININTSNLNDELNNFNPESIYTTYFVNELQIDEVISKKNIKQEYTFDFFSLLLIANKDCFIEMSNCFHFDLDNIVICPSCIQFLLIYSLYLEKIEYYQNKILFIPVDNICFLLELENIEKLNVKLDNNDINELTIYLNKLLQISNLIIIEYIKNSGNDKLYLDMNTQIQTLSNIIELLNKNQLFNINKAISTINFINNNIEAFNKLSSSKEIIKNAKNNADLITEFKKISNLCINKINYQIKTRYDSLKIQFRGVIASIVFQTLVYTNNKIEKITTYINSFKNILRTSNYLDYYTYQLNIFNNKLNNDNTKNFNLSNNNIYSNSLISSLSHNYISYKVISKHFCKLMLRFVYMNVFKEEQYNKIINNYLIDCVKSFYNEITSFINYKTLTKYKSQNEDQLINKSNNLQINDNYNFSKKYLLILT